MRLPYRSPAAPAAEPEDETPGHDLPDAELVVLLVFAAPIFLAVMIRTALSGETFGAGPTVCGAMVVAAVALSISAWRARKTPPRLPPSGGSR